MYHPLSEEIRKLVQTHTQATDADFVRTQIAFYIGVVAASMQVKVKSVVTGEVPVNVYATNFAPSGAGKTSSLTFLEEKIFNMFYKNFSEGILPYKQKSAIEILALNLTARENIDSDKALQTAHSIFEKAGKYRFTFDSGTPAAVKQFRELILLQGLGALNFIVDEAGSNLQANQEVLNLFLELYDKGLLRDKLTKHTNENKRSDELRGSAPANMLLFGTPASLIDGGVTEKIFFNMLETGFARRCFFYYTDTVPLQIKETPAQALQRLKQAQASINLGTIADDIGSLADFGNISRVLKLTDAAELALLEYKNKCQDEADSYGDYSPIQKTEAQHRFFKAVKLAGAYAFIDKSPQVTETHLEYAITFAEKSKDSLKRLCEQPPKYEILGKFLRENAGTQFTIADLQQKLPFFRQSAAMREEMLSLAQSWGYTNNLSIKKHIKNNVTLYEGMSLMPTELDKLIITESQDLARGYKNHYTKWSQLIEFVKHDLNFTNHHTENGVRKAEHMIMGFNFIVLDVDGGTTINTVKSFLQGYKYLIYTTKSHLKVKDEDGFWQERFRIILPVSHVTRLSPEDFKQFLRNFIAELPFPVDTAATDISRKWATNPNAEVHVGDGKLLDVYPYLPNTTEETNRKAELAKIEDLDKTASWFLLQAESSGRNNSLFRYAMMLRDSGYELDSVKSAVLDLNSRLKSPLPEEELNQTVFATLMKGTY